MKWIVFFLLGFFFGVNPTVAQAPRGVFLTDTMEIGQPFQYSLRVRHPASLELLFPDTARHFRPFLVRDVDIFTTSTDATGSLDSVVYTLVSFETGQAQQLRVPVFTVNSPQDCTAFFSNTDTIYLRERIQTTRLDTLQLSTETQVIALRQQMNYPFLLTILAGIVAVAGVVYLLFGKAINTRLALYRMRRQHQEFERAYLRLTRNLNPDTASESVGKTIIIWKEYLEWLEDKPFSTMTTREMADSMLDDRLADALKEIDGVVYGGMYSDQTQASLRVLREIADHSYQRQRAKIAEAQQKKLPTND
ncbi:hypothetical protein [Tellurirhabdus bombi]|uniref:hypothetical protein n=1 Tax=Tellurirhabdus bombi TaxID=2907205 RepID=UPI001F3E82E1|nr:hypothetical protein [Tellurirhabdus bombi]